MSADPSTYAFAPRAPLFLVPETRPESGLDDRPSPPDDAPPVDDSLDDDAREDLADEITTPAAHIHAAPARLLEFLIALDSSGCSDTARGPPSRCIVSGPRRLGCASSSPDARLIYDLPRPAHDGRTVVRVGPLELLDRLARLIPPPRVHRHRCRGVLRPKREVAQGGDALWAWRRG